MSHSATFSFKRPCKGGESSKTQKMCHDVYNCGELLILQDLLNERVPEGMVTLLTADPHDLIFPPWKKTFYCWLHFLVGGGNLFFS